MVKNSLIREGYLILGGTISWYVLSHIVEKKYKIKRLLPDSILIKNIIFGKNSKSNKAILEKNFAIPPITKIGINKEDDDKRLFYVSEVEVIIVN